MLNRFPLPPMNRYEELQALINTFEKDFTKFYEKGNKEAGIRLRKHMQTLRAFAKQVRDEVQERKDAHQSPSIGE